MRKLYKPTDADWPMLGPALRKLEFANYLRDTDNTDDDVNKAVELFLYTGGFTRHLGDSTVKAEPKRPIRRLNLIAEDKPGYFLKTFIITPGQNLRLYITTFCHQLMGVEFDFHLYEDSKLEIYYLGSAQQRQSHARFRINHCSPNSHSIVKTATVAEKNSAATAMVEINMPSGCRGSSSEVRSFNWANGGRVGSLPIITVAEPDVVAAHGNVVYSLDHEAVFLLQLRGLSAASARREILYGQLIAGLGSEHEIEDWPEARECIGYRYPYVANT